MVGQGLRPVLRRAQGRGACFWGRSLCPGAPFGGRNRVPVLEGHRDVDHTGPISGGRGPRTLIWNGSGAPNLVIWGGSHTLLWE